MLLKSNKRILFILAVLTILILIPCSFAGDLDNETLSVDDSEIVADGDNVIYVENGDNEGDGSIDNPYNSVSAAVNTYNSSQHSKVYIKNGDYDIDEQIIIKDKEVNIVGESKTGTVLNGNSLNSIFKLDLNSKVTFTNITFKNANNGGAIDIDFAASLNIYDCIFDNNLKGAIYKYDSDISGKFNLIIDNSIFSNNKNVGGFKGDGGAILINNGNLVNITNSIFENNYLPIGETDVTDGGAIYCGSNLKTFYVENCDFINNTAIRGSAISQSNTGNAYIYNCTFINNTSPGNSRYNTNSSVIYDNQDPNKGFSLYLKNNYFENNKINDDIEAKGVAVVYNDKNTRITASNLDKIYGDDLKYVVTLTNSSGNPLVGKEIIVTLTNNYNNQITTLNNITDSNGKAIFNLKNQTPGKYSVITKFEGDGELDEISTNNIITIRTENSYNAVFRENPVKMIEGESYNITLNIYDEYFVPTNALNGKSFSVDWYDFNGKHMAIDVNSVKVEGSQLVWDINRLHLVTRDEPYVVNFNIGDTVSANLTVDLSVNMTNIDPSLGTYYVSISNGSDETGDGSKLKPLATLQTALVACRIFGGEKTIMIEEGIYEISNFNVLSNVTIIGQKSKTVLKQTTGILGMFEIDNANIVNLINLTFINGYATPSPDALIHVGEDSTAYIDGCEFANNSAVEGGAISISTGGKAYIYNSYFHDNKAILGKNGGAIYVDRGYLYVSNSLFVNNTAGDGGAIYLGFPAEALIVNTEFVNNTAAGSSSVAGSGGAIFTRSNDLVVENSTFIENFADYGGAIFIDYGAANVYKSYFENNKVKPGSNDKGSAIQGSYNSYCNLTLNYSILISEESNNNLYLVYIPNIDENHTIDLDYNLWKTNSQKSNVGSNYSVVIEISTENEFIYTGDIVEFTVSFLKYNVYEGNSPLDDIMHDFELIVIPNIGQIAEEDIVTIKNNKAVFYYNATTVGTETISAGNIFKFTDYRFDVQDGSDKIKLNPVIDVVTDKTSTITVTFDKNVTGSITIRICESDYPVEINNSKAILKLDILPGNYTAKVIFRGDENYRGFVENKEFIVAKFKSNITIGEATIYYNGNYQARLTDDEGKSISGEKLNLIVNNTSYEAITDENGIASFELNLPFTGRFNVEVKYLGNSKYDASSANSSINVEFATVKLSAQENATITPIKGEFSVTLTDNNNNPLRNTKVIFIFNGIHEVFTDNEGIATLNLNNTGLDAGKYNITAKVEPTAVYSGDEIETQINVQKAIAIIKADDVSVFANNGEFIVLLTDDQGNPLNNRDISVKIGNGIENIITTNSSGIATLTLSLNPGNYTALVKLVENRVYRADEVSANVNVKENIVNIIAPDVFVYYSNGKFLAILKDVDGIPIPNARLIISIDNDYLATTDSNGIATININNLGIGNYVVVTKFEGNAIFQAKNTTSTIKVVSSISANDMTRAYNSPYDFQAILKDSNGNPVANQSVDLIVNGKSYAGKTDSNGILNFAGKLAVGTYAITVTNPATGEKTSNYATIVKRLAENKNVKMYFGAGSAYKVRVIGDDGKAVGSGEIVKINIAGKNVDVKTDKNGYASYKLNTLKDKTYTITATYKGVKVSNKIVVKPVLTAKNISKKKAKKIKFSAKLVNTKGKALKGKKITFKIKGKTYKAKTNKKGVATVGLKNLKVGKYKITVKYGKSTIKKTIKIKK